MRQPLASNKEPGASSARPRSIVREAAENTVSSGGASGSRRSARSRHESAGGSNAAAQSGIRADRRPAEGGAGLQKQSTRQLQWPRKQTVHGRRGSKRAAATQHSGGHAASRRRSSSSTATPEAEAPPKRSRTSRSVHAGADPPRSLENEEPFNELIGNDFTPTRTLTNMASLRPIERRRQMAE